MRDPILYMAPMKGFTEHIFRNLFTTHFGGFDLAVAPFIASRSDRSVKKKHVKDLLPENNTRLQFKIHEMCATGGVCAKVVVWVNATGNLVSATCCTGVACWWRSSWPCYWSPGIF